MSLWKFYYTGTDDLVLSHIYVFFGTQKKAEQKAKQLSEKHDIDCEAREVSLFDM